MFFLAAAPTLAAPFLFDEPEEQRPSLTLAQARSEDIFWEGCYRHERYFRAGCVYEDYAPAYCAGYVGYAQYGGRFEDAERSMVSNWLRIRGDSRLDLEDAQSAIRAAWRRMEQTAARADRWMSLHAAAAARAALSVDALQDEGAATETHPAIWQRAAPQALTAQP